MSSAIISRLIAFSVIGVVGFVVIVGGEISSSRAAIGTAAPQYAVAQRAQAQAASTSQTEAASAPITEADEARVMELLQPDANRTLQASVKRPKSPFLKSAPKWDLEEEPQPKPRRHATASKHTWPSKAVKKSAPRSSGASSKLRPFSVTGRYHQDSRIRLNDELFYRPVTDELWPDRRRSAYDPRRPWSLNGQRTYRHRY